MPGWVVPHSRYPTTYNGEPLAYVSIGAQKKHNALYLIGLASEPELDRSFRADWAATGRRLDMGRSCLRFRTLTDVDLDLVGRAVAAAPVDRLIAGYERSRQ